MSRDMKSNRSRTEVRPGGLILAGDLGGTNFRLEGRIDGDTVFSRRYTDVTEYGSLSALLADALGHLPRRPSSTCIAVAGRVDPSGRHALVTNLGWQVASAELEQLQLGQVFLINDFEAVALGIGTLQPEEIVAIGEATGRAGDAVVLGPGTGLGVAFRFTSPVGYFAKATECGHQEWPARTEMEWAIRMHIAGEKALRTGGGLTSSSRRVRVSYEDVVSGPGLLRLHAAVRHIREGCRPTGDSCGGGGAVNLPEAVAAGARRREPICQEAVGIFVESLAVLASDLALQDVPGGVYITGAMVRKNEDLFLGSRFREVFDAKAPHEQMLKSTPVYLVCTDREVGVEGAALRALAQE